MAVQGVVVQGVVVRAGGRSHRVLCSELSEKTGEELLDNPEGFKVVEQLLAQTGDHPLDSALAFPQHFSYHRVATRRPLRLF